MNIHLTEHVASGASRVRPVLLAQLARYHDDGAADPPILDAAGVRIPIHIVVGARTGNPPDGARVGISARRHRERYPVFSGTIRIVPIDSLNSELVLDGRYDVPLGLLGVLADRTVLATTAESSLGRLLARMKAELSEAVLRGVMGSGAR